MKSLDETIKKYEMCSSQITCSTCPYSQEICSCDPDALHYLKEYKRQMKRNEYAKANHDDDEVSRRWEESFRASQMPWNHYTEMGG